MFGGRLRAPASSCVSHRGRRREKCPPDPAANQLCPPRSAKVELGGLGCGIRIFARKGRVRKDTAQDAGFGLDHGVRVSLPILPRPHPKSQHPGITHRAGRPAPGGSPPYPAPPHPQSRETGKPGVEYQLEFEEKSGQRHPLLPHYSSLMDDYFFIFPRPSLTVPLLFPHNRPKELGGRPNSNHLRITPASDLCTQQTRQARVRNLILLYTPFSAVKRKREIFRAPFWPYRPLWAVARAPSGGHWRDCRRAVSGLE